MDKPDRPHPGSYVGDVASGVQDVNKDGEKISINLITAYGLVLGQCTN